MLQVRLVQINTACPESYEAYVEDRKVAYLRLRHGVFSVRCIDGNKEVYCSSPEGDGIFEEHERAGELQRAVNAIARHLKQLEEEKLAEYVIVDRHGASDTGG
jgi:hypothetical protein